MHACVRLSCLWMNLRCVLCLLECVFMYVCVCTYNTCTYIHTYIHTYRKQQSDKLRAEARALCVTIENKRLKQELKKLQALMRPKEEERVLMQLEETIFMLSNKVCMCVGVGVYDIRMYVYKRLKQELKKLNALMKPKCHLSWPIVYYV